MPNIEVWATAKIFQAGKIDFLRGSKERENVGIIKKNTI